MLTSHLNQIKDTLDQKNKKYNKYSIRQIIELLESLEIITSSDRAALQEAMNIRNSVVHDRHQLPPEVALETKNILSSIIAKLSNANK